MSGLYYIGWGLIVLLALRFGVTLVNFLSRPWLPAAVDDGRGWPLLSVLIPARNEEENLPQLLEDLKRCTYPHLEVWVCDDHSTDTTSQILESCKAEWSSLHWFKSAPLPSGWMGKNHACHQLAQRAGGDYLLFVDADVRLQPQSLQAAVGYAQKRRLLLLSVFPHQLLLSRGEKQVVPLMNWILLSLLPLVAVRLPWFTSLSAANGQFMLFAAEGYHQHQWHQKVRGQAVEDIAVARGMKQARLPIAVGLGQSDILCRMYRSAEEARAGFTRNTHQFFGGSRLWMLLFVAIQWLRLPFLLLSGQYGAALLALFLESAILLMVAQLSSFSLLSSLLGHPVRLLNLSRIAWRNVRSGRQVRWKGRSYSVTAVTVTAVTECLIYSL